MVVDYKVPKERTKLKTNEEIALDTQFRKRMKTIRRKNGDCLEDDPDSGVVYLSQIPHSFCEEAMFKYFSQFGRIKRIRLSRCRKSAKSRGFAYVEFEYAEVAKIVAETMNNYLMYRKLIRCKVVPKEELHPDTFKGCFRKFGKPRGRMNSIRRNNSYVNADTKRVSRTLKRKAKQEEKKEKLLKEMGIDFKIDGYEHDFYFQKMEWEAAKVTFAKPGEPTKTQKASPETEDVERQVATDEVEQGQAEVTERSEQPSVKETADSSSADGSKRSTRRSMRKGKKDKAEEIKSSQRLDPKETLESMMEAEESLPGDVDKISPKGMRTRSRKGAKKDEQEDAPVSRPRTQKKREVGRIPAEEKAIKRDKNTPKRKKSSARN
ncbi:uncharacterized protein [Apostichopus japonicus]|uniref:uncharacterized protein isoform X3 n=1 Tax=Stichopus japonicus TaxID=307972 RepID=UPI003AB35419